jgi:hypothetical protein
MAPAEPSDMSRPGRIFRTKDDLAEDEKAELEMLLSELTVASENMAKGKSRGVKRRYGGDESGVAERMLNNGLFRLLRD